MVTPDSEQKTGFSGVSIVIPVYNDSIRVRKAIDSVFQASLLLSAKEQSGLELIIVDDNSLEPFMYENRPIPFTCLRMPKNQGAGRARNLGADSALFSHILFLDSDVILDRNYLKVLFSRLRNNSGIKVIQWPHATIPSGENPSLFQRYMAVSWYLDMFDTKTSDSSTAFFCSACVTIDKLFFRKLGGFVEYFTGSGGEEYEIAGRISIMGRDLITLDPGLVSYHEFDTFAKRITKLLFRSRQYQNTVGRIKSLPFKFKCKVCIRALFGFGLSLIMIASFLSLFLPSLRSVMPWFIYAGGYLIFGLADCNTTRGMLKHHSLRLAAASVFFRQAEYTVIVIGILVGFVKAHRHAS